MRNRSSNANSCLSCFWAEQVVWMMLFSFTIIIIYYFRHIKYFDTPIIIFPPEYDYFWLVWVNLTQSVALFISTFNPRHLRRCHCRCCHRCRRRCHHHRSRLPADPDLVDCCMLWLLLLLLQRVQPPLLSLSPSPLPLLLPSLLPLPSLPSSLSSQSTADGPPFSWLLYVVVVVVVVAASATPITFAVPVTFAVAIAVAVAVAAVVVVIIAVDRHSREAPKIWVLDSKLNMVWKWLSGIHVDSASSISSEPSWWATTWQALGL